MGCTDCNALVEVFVVRLAIGPCFMGLIVHFAQIAQACIFFFTTFRGELVV
jgi:hypothetical protein